METPLVSVIIPNYNHARYLDLRIQTVLNQTYQNFEVIILDDHSTDNSLVVIEKYKEDPHVSAVVVNEENSGNTFKQWKKGIQMARGDLVWIAESDDYCELNLLERLVSLYQSRKNVVVVYSEVIPVDGEGNIIGHYKTLLTGTSARKHVRFKIRGSLRMLFRRIKYSNRIISGRSFLKRYLCLDCAIKNASGAIFKREMAERISDEYIIVAAAGDYVFWTELCQLGKVALNYERLSYFRQHVGSVTDRRNADGSNMVQEFNILRNIRTKYRIGPLRMHMIMARHAERFKNIHYETEDVRDMVYQLWNIEYYLTRKDSWICYISKRMFDLFRIKL